MRLRPLFNPARSRAVGRRRALTALGAIAALSVCHGASQHALAGEAPGFKLIVHPDNQNGSATRQFCTDAFLKRVTSWGDGNAIKPVDQHRDAEVRQSFSERVLKRSVAAVRRYWQQRIFSGRGVPPPELDSDQAVVNYVLSHSGAIGYVRADAQIGSARVLALR